MVEIIPPALRAEIDQRKDAQIADLERQIAELRAELVKAEESWAKAASNGIADFNRAEAAEAENARLRALPLKDEVERVLDRVSATVKRYRRAGLGDDVFHSDLCETDAAIDALISRLTADNEDLTKHVAFLRDALGKEHKSIWRDAKLSASTEEAVEAILEWSADSGRNAAIQSQESGNEG